MLVASVSFESETGQRPAVVLVHGAASSLGVWRYWQQGLTERGWASFALDLRGHGRSQTTDLARTSMDEYASDLRSLIQHLARPPFLVGWSMGGLVALMAAADGLAAGCVALAPSMPSRDVDARIVLHEGTFDAAEYGVTSQDPTHQPAMPDLDHEERIIALASLGQESRYARDERKRGVLIPSLPCPLLLVTGSADDQWPSERYQDLWLPHDHLVAAGASHWGLVLNRRALAETILPGVDTWMNRVSNDEPRGAGATGAHLARVRASLADVRAGRLHTFGTTQELMAAIDAADG